MHRTGQPISKKLAGMGKPPFPIQICQTAALISETRTGNGRRGHLASSKLIIEAEKQSEEKEP